MLNINLQGLLRSVSIIIISLVVFLYIGLNTLTDDIVFKSADSQPGKKYEYRTAPAGISIPKFTNNLESLFPRKIIPEVVAAKIIHKPVTPVNTPSLQFVGMIETDKKIIYSFRNLDTNKLLLFEEGVVLEGITLVSTEEEKYTFKKNEITFQVGN
ncbi:MAG: hypothetical protein KAQ93_05925 [Spirochaetales bacterium]|nr:hypothetical protein [Spirochaetales bacterium]